MTAQIGQLGIAELWTAAGVLLGFQVTAFMWRIGREIDVSKSDTEVARARASANADDDVRADQEDHMQPNWLTPSDMVNLAGMVVLVVGVFISPVVWRFDPMFGARAIALATLLFVGHCFALAGHYELYNIYSSRSFDYFPVQERVAVVLVALVGAVLLYGMSQ